MTRLTPLRHARGRVALTLVAALGAVAALLPSGAATAAPGPAPESSTRTVLTDTHVDVLSVGVAAGQLTLHSKADLERAGTRFYPDDVIVNVEDAARTTVPDDPAYAFLGAAGAEAWIAPETRREGVVWPGLDTEGLAAGAVDGDAVEIALTSATGPGRVEVWTESGSGPERLFSGDAGLGNVLEFPAGAHRHANWGFTAPGRYLLTFEVRAAIGGVPQAASATVRFHVGPVPPAAATTSTLAADPAETTAGTPVTLAATVTPADANGAVEFAAGDVVLGHADVDGGAATLETAGIPLGRQTVTARFVPTWTDEFGPSAAEPVTVNVRQPGAAADFEITGLEDDYVAGDTLRLSVAGYVLGPDQSVRWIATSPDPQQEPVTLAGVTGAGPLALERVLTTAYDGWLLRAQIRTGSAVDATTAPVRLSVGGTDAGSGEAVTVAPIEATYYWGVAVPLVASHRALSDGESLRWVERTAVGDVAWRDTHATYGPVGAGPWSVVSNFMQYKEFALQLRAADGTVLGQSAPQRYSLTMRSIELGGLRDLYRVGERASLSASVSPDLGDGLEFVWELWQGGGDRLLLDDGAALPTAEFEVTKAMQDRTLYLRVYSQATDQLVGYVTVPFNVTTAAEGDQVLTMAAIDGHYHTGTPVSMDLTADPAPASSDVVRFWWKRSDWPEFRQIPGTAGMSHAVIAEQALDGTQIRADLVDSDGEVLATTTTQTIHVDDHGAPPPQGVVIDGLAPAYDAGDTAVLTARVSPSSVLTRYVWRVQRPGDPEPVVVDGANGPRLELPVTADLGGATVTAQLTFDDGRVYVTSLPATLSVDGAGPDPGGPSERIVATLAEGQGALVVSVDPDDDVVTMSDFELGAAADRWSSAGELRPVTVTDTRSGAPGWVVSGQAGDFTAGAAVLPAEYLGWTPIVAGRPDGGAVRPGDPVVPGPGSATGLSVSSPLAVADAGSGFGTSRLGAGLLIEAPTTLVPGIYEATITFTAI
ncbi:choice-of-anchor M domain-containing protein [Jiangella mangrovi]|uniref:Surface-anchored protein n=1 Tax=Jiangella mangrovi TaxID=1524084 RepID=A0A7W9LM72_9ACTN|nr:choice-of-anchor M domain-containing protein [Jiangella mangrovi]MBB5788817.1 surface-anchored protein [Jiangella mangrovi]